VSAARIGYDRKKSTVVAMEEETLCLYMVIVRRLLRAFKTDAEVAFFGMKTKVQVIGKTQLQYKVLAGPAPK
jgi:hypothetical protein